MIYVDHTALVILASIGYLGFLARNITRKRTVVQHIVLTVFWFYIAGVLAITLFPIPVVPDLSGHQAPHNLMPLSTIGRLVSLPLRHMVRPLLGNILLLCPLGFFIAMLKRNMRLAHIILAGFLCSLAIELIQLSIGLIIRFSYRSFDVDDIILNTIGYMSGYVAIRLFSRWNRWADEATRKVV